MTTHAPAPWATHLTALATERAALACPHCGLPRPIIRDDATLPVPGLRLAACDCGEGR